MLQPSIAITAAALASSMGCSVEELQRNLSCEQRGLSYSHRFSDQIASPLGEIPWEDLGVSIEDPHNSDRLALLGCSHVLGQLAQNSEAVRKFPANRLGLFVGTTTAGINSFFDVARNLKTSGLPLETLLRSDMQQAQLGHQLAEKFQLRGPVYTFSASCAASAQAFIMAHDAVKMGWVDAAIVLGVDILNLVTLHGFNALQLIDPNFCQPFTEQRAGINLSEAVVGLVLEKVEERTMATRIRSYASLSEAHHMTQPAPGGEWMRICMEKALTKARLDPQDISYINPHGTGTLANDEGESKAIAGVFGGIGHVQGSKRLTGHTLGASGALELLISSLALEGKSSDPFQKVFGLKNSFGFGGANVSIILERGGL